jgi:hypothetical protein
MDDIVKQALAKWPNVPDCYGWLGLDNRGDWYMRDGRIQAQGMFPHPKGSRLLHEKLIDFIGRNYEGDAQGRWFFQNGPQKVFVELETAPWVWRLRLTSTALEVASHTGRPAQLISAYADELGRLFLHTHLGFGLVHTQDILDAANAIEGGLLHPLDVDSQQLAKQFSYVRSPKALHDTQPDRHTVT